MIPFIELPAFVQGLIGVCTVLLLFTTVVNVILEISNYTPVFKNSVFVANKEVDNMVTVPTIDDATSSVTIRDEHGKKRKFKMSNAYSQSLAQADSNSKTHEAEFYVRGKRLVKVVMDGNTIGA